MLVCWTAGPGKGIGACCRSGAAVLSHLPVIRSVREREVRKGAGESVRHAYA